MADNPYVNKVVLGNDTLIDITDTTATANDVATGKIFYNAAGARTAGAYTPQGTLPQGGSADDVLTKASATDYDTTWTAPPWVEKTGDTMTGALQLKSSNVDGTDIPASASPDVYQYGSSELALFDANGVRYGYFLPQNIGGGLRGVQFAATRNVNGSDIYHAIQLNIDSSGNPNVFFNYPQAWRDGLSAVNKTGDTMTGDLTISKSDDTPRFIAKNSNIDITGTNLPSSTQYDGIYFRDGNDSNIGYCESSQTSTGKLYTDLAVRNGSSLTNRLRLGIENGTRTVDVGNAQSAWLAALGLTVEKTTTLSSIAENAGSGRVDSAEYWQYGSIAHVHLVVTTTAAISSLTTVASMKTGKRPVSYSVLGSTNKNVIGAYINANGAVRINGTTTIASGTELHLYCTYILA